MKDTTSVSRLRATLSSRWWREQLKQLRHCYSCGGRLVRRYVKEEGTRRRVCVKCSTITYTNPKVVAGCIPVMPDGRVALLKRSIEPARGKWSYPAGYMEIGETVEAAALRETQEEIGVRAKITGLVGIYSYTFAGVVTIIYEAQVLKGEKPRAEHEASAVKMVAPADIPWKTLAFRSTIDALKDWTDKEKQCR